MILRRTVALAALLLASVAEASGTPPPGCVGSLQTKTWAQLDANYDYGPTTITTTAVYFSVSVPCYVTFDTDFVVTVSVRDELCNPSGTGSYGSGGSNYTGGSYFAGDMWNVTDTPDASALTTIAGVGYTVASPGFMKLAFDGTWVATVTQHYGPSGTPTNHTMGFRFIPRVKDGCYVGAMNWQPQWITTTVIDPYPDTTVVDPGPVPSTGPGGTGSTAGTGSGGCGSSGATPALLGLAALLAAAWPRRRARA